MDPTSDGNSGYSEQPIPPGNTVPTPTDNVAPPKLNKDRMRYVVLDCLDARKPRPEILAKLMAYGLSEIDADRFIEEVEREQRRTSEYDDEHRSDARFRRRFGAGTFLGGVVGLVGCITAACNGYGLAENPLLLAAVFIAGLAVLLGSRMFWLGT